MIDTIYSDPDFLMHYGRKGMKWGRHIFGDSVVGGQGGKATGTARLAAGMGGLRKSKRPNKADKIVDEQRKQLEFEKEHSHKAIFEKSKSMSDAELDRVIKRMNKERNYRQLMEDELKAGRSYVDNKIVQMGDKTINGLTGIASKKAIGMITQ